MKRSVEVYHKDRLLNKFHLENITAFSIEELVAKIRWRESRPYDLEYNTGGSIMYDFEYGIGGSPNDEYFKIKSIKLVNNDTKFKVKVRKIK